MAKTDKPLWEYTRDLHHACEAHEVGGALATGKPPKIWYLAWVTALYQIHEELDKHCDDILRREYECLDDITQLILDLNKQAGWSDAATKYVVQLDTPEKIDGAIYVLTGAHLMGGEIMRRRLEGYPTKHLEWEDRKAALAILQQYRLRDDIGDEARACFSALLSIMDEIKEKFPNGS
jgi:hypothetical protein